MNTFWTKTCRIIGRLLPLPALLFMVVMSLDVFGGPSSLIDQILGFLIHLIPGLVLAGVLVLAWRRPAPGGWLLLALGAAMAVFFKGAELGVWLILIFPVFFSGLLVLLGHRLAGRTGGGPVKEA